MRKNVSYNVEITYLINLYCCFGYIGANNFISYTRAQTKYSNTISRGLLNVRRDFIGTKHFLRYFMLGIMRVVLFFIKQFHCCGPGVPMCSRRHLWLHC